MSSLCTFTRRLAAPLLLVVAAACAPDGPTQPLTPQPDASLLGGVVGTVGGLTPHLLACPTSKSYSATTVVGRDGGFVGVGPHVLSIPPGALSSDIKITATAPAGNYVQVGFEPHGLRFAKPTALTLSYAQCGLLSTLLKPRIVYVDDDYTILETLLSLNLNLLSKTVTGRVDHFSSYIVAY